MKQLECIELSEVLGLVPKPHYILVTTYTLILELIFNRSTFQILRDSRTPYSNHN
jgi:hypothetical protein